MWWFQLHQVAHEYVCISVIKVYHQFTSSLTTCHNDCQELKALGLPVLLCKPIIVAVILMLLEMFEHKGPFGLLLQKGSSTLCLVDIATQVELSKSKLISRKEECKWLTLQKFIELKNLAEEETLSLPISVRACHSDQFNWESFINAAFYPFVDAFIEEMRLSG